MYAWSASQRGSVAVSAVPPIQPVTQALVASRSVGAMPPLKLVWYAMLRSVSPDRGVPSLEWHDAQVAPLPLAPRADGRPH